MNNIALVPASLFSAVKGDFSALWKCRNLGDSLELISPYTSVHGDSVSVFITCRQDRYVVTDGANVHRIAKELSVNLEDRKGLHLEDLLDLYGLKEWHEASSHQVYRFKSTTDVNCVSSCVFDLIHFQEGVLNAINLSMMFDLNEDAGTKRFNTKVKEILSEKIFRIPAKERRYDFYQDDSLSAYRFNTTLVDKRTNELWLGMCIYCSNYSSFSNAVYRAEFGFSHIIKDSAVSRGSLNLASVKDVMPNELARDNRVQPLADAIKSWKLGLGVANYELPGFVNIELHKLWKKAA